MPKKEIEFKNNFNIRITDEQKAKWNEYLDEHKKFSSVSHFIRWCVDEIVDGTHSRRKVINNDKESLKLRIEENEKMIERILEEQRDVLKAIAMKTETPKEMKPIREYQKGLIINLLKKEMMDETELNEILDDLNEIEILNMINELMEASIIEQENDKYRVI